MNAMPDLPDVWDHIDADYVYNDIESAGNYVRYVIGSGAAEFVNEHIGVYEDIDVE